MSATQVPIQGKSLTPIAPSYPARAQAAGRQLGIAAKLNQDLERRQFVELLKRISAKDALNLLSHRPELDCDLIERFEDRWDWKKLSRFTAPVGSLELIERFDYRWDWEGLSNNSHLPWSRELIERYKYHWTWGGIFNWGLSENAALPWSPELIDCFKDHWDWGGCQVPAGYKPASRTIEVFQPATSSAPERVTNA
jgi:hypothetical protein